jgi:small subunit ribosomal protein S14
MLSSRIKDIKLRNSFSKVEKKKLLNKFLFVNLLNKKQSQTQMTAVLLKSFLNKKYNSKVRNVRQCVFNGRTRGVLRDFGISRVYLRELMLFGLVPGYSKAVW